MKRLWWGVLALLIPLTLYGVGLAYGRPRAEYAPSVEQRAWLNPNNVYHPDSFAYVGIPYRMLLKKSWNPHYYHNPSLLLNINRVLFGLSGAAGMPHDLAYGDREIAPFQLYVMGRWMSVLYSLLAVVLTYAAGRVAFGMRAGLIAAALVGVSPLMTEYARYTIPVALTTMLATAALLAAVIVAKDRRPARLPLSVLYAVAGLLVGLTMSARYNAVVVGLVTGTMMLGRWWPDRRRWWLPAIAGIAGVIGFVVGTPGIVFDTQEVIRQIRDILDWYRERGGGPGYTADHGLESAYYHWRYVVLMAAGPLEIAAALAGLVVVWRRLRVRGWWRWLTSEAGIAAALALYMLVYTLLALLGRRLQVNLLLPLIAPLALLAGVALARLPRRWGLIAVAAVVIWPLTLSVLFAYRVSVPDNRMRAQEWVYAHVPRGASIHLLGPYNVPLDPLDYDLTQSYGGEFGADNLRQSTAQIVVYSDAYPWRVLRDPDLSPASSVAREQEIRDVLQTQWIELAQFDRMPWPGEKLAPDDVSYWHQMQITIYCNPADCPVAGARP